MSKRTLLLCIFILVKLVLQYVIINPAYDLQRDEYLHLDQAKHLAWGFESVPPFSSWIAWLILQLGNAVFWVKFFPALFGALTMVVVWKAIEALNGNVFSLILGATAVTLSALVRLNMLFQPNSFDVLCWTFLYFSYLRFIQTNSNKWIMIAAITFAIGFLNKYNITFLVLGLLPAILLSKHRNLFNNKYFYFSVIVALVIISPNLIWQYHQNFPVIHHLKTLSKTQLINVNRADFLKEQLLFFFGAFYVIVASLIAFSSYGEFKKYRLFGWSFLFTLVIFVYFKAKGYYGIGIYPIYLAFGAVYLEQILKTGWRRYLRPVAILVIVLFFIPFGKIALPIFTPEKTYQNGKQLKNLGLLRWEDGKDHLLPQDYADMLGWHELAMKTDSAVDLINNMENTLVLCDNYGQAGAVNYYSKRKNIAAVSMNADYINWFPLDKKEIKNLVLVVEEDETEKELIRGKQLFKTAILSGKIENPYAREKGTSIIILKEALTDINKILQEEINEIKSKK